MKRNYIEWLIWLFLVILWNYEYPDEEISFDSYIIEESDLKDNQKRMLDVDNPLVVPEGTRIKFLVTGNDVMHSFFVPSLALQVYSIAGRINEIWTEIPIGEKISIPPTTSGNLCVVVKNIN